MSTQCLISRAWAKRALLRELAGTTPRKGGRGAHGWRSVEGGAGAGKQLPAACVATWERLCRRLCRAELTKRASPLGRSTEAAEGVPRTCEMHLAMAGVSCNNSEVKAARLDPSVPPPNCARPTRSFGGRRSRPAPLLIIEGPGG